MKNKCYLCKSKKLLHTHDTQKGRTPRFVCEKCKKAQNKAYLLRKKAKKLSTV